MYTVLSLTGVSSTGRTHLRTNYPCLLMVSLPDSWTKRTEIEADSITELSKELQKYDTETEFTHNSQQATIRVGCRPLLSEGYLVSAFENDAFIGSATFTHRHRAMEEAYDCMNAYEESDRLPEPTKLKLLDH